MPYKISHIEEENIVCIQGSGRLAMEEYMKGSKEVVDLLKKHDSTHLLVDDRLVENVASTLDLYSLPEFFKKIGLSFRVRVAFLYDAESVSKTDFSFFDTVCRNVGYNMKAFYSYDDAMEWLKNK